MPRDWVNQTVISFNSHKKSDLFLSLFYRWGNWHIQKRLRNLFKVIQNMLNSYFYKVIRLGGGLVTKSCLTLETPWTVACHGIFQARILEWIAISFSRGIFPTQESNLGLLHCRQILYWLSYKGSPQTTNTEKQNSVILKMTWEPPGKELTRMCESEATSKGSSDILKDETVLTRQRSKRRVWLMSSL